jgi:UDP-N-acetylmuramoylalanine--D-glutamate ligase
MKHYDIAILGAGESGTGAALLAKIKGMKVFVSDLGTIQTAYKKELISNGIDYEEQGNTLDIILSAKEVIKSPGISNNIPLIKIIEQKKINIIDEVEFAYRYTKAKFIAITGTNGKTTTSMLIYYLLKNSGFKVSLGGNVGKSIAKQVIEDKYDYHILEISSFQLERVQSFTPYIGILLNITPDHLDMYQGDMAKYAAAKARIVKNMSKGESLIYLVDDDNIKKTLEKAENKNYTPYKLSLCSPYADAYLDHSNAMILNVKNQNTKMFLQKNLPGKHNALNALAAATTGLLLNINADSIQSSLNSFTLPNHRNQLINTVNDIKFYDDSKATNVEATYAALQTFNNPIIWIAGGKDKGNKYDILHPLVKEKVKAIIYLGVENAKIKEAFRYIKKQYETTNMEDAVKMAYHYSEAGDIVLLSPTCSSLDLFKNYEARGDKFKEATINLQQSINTCKA